MDEAGCSCHINPPCGWCTSLTEEEVEIYAVYGVDAVVAHREELTEEATAQPASLWGTW